MNLKGSESSISYQEIFLETSAATAIKRVCQWAKGTQTCNVTALIGFNGFDLDLG